MIELFDEAGVRGFLHARHLGSTAEVSLDADAPVVLASVVKVPLVLEFARQVAAGQLDPTDRVKARAADRLGGTGMAGCADDVEMSLRDAALAALSVSDNTAADLLFDRVGVGNVRSLMAELGLTSTRIVGAPKDVLRTIIEDEGRDVRALDPLRTTASTAREMTRLLELVWRDEAGPPEACRQVRDLLGFQLNWYRVAAAFDDDVAYAGKTGTLPQIRNEIGVVTYPDGEQYAIAVFTTGRYTGRRPDIDRAIGAAARTAVDQLRA
ncbi:serine hydrolase [Amycolatopsis sp. cg5]|uniref:serine hydrolase n=1 Tax=Amycolatopsis sp. cg5 TaxID=3238802 RepID=UPI0035258A48